MSTKKWEQFIDTYLNEDQERAEQLFHEIIVESSREIYEKLMESTDQVENLLDEIEVEEAGADGVMEADDELDMDMDDAESDMDDAEVDMDDAEMDMDDADADMDDAEMDMDDAEGDMDMDDESDGAPATKDDIMNLEDKLDELMAEFEAMMHSSDDGEDADVDADADEAGEEDEEEVMESVQLKKVGGETYNKFGKMGDDGAQTKSPVAANAGAKGPVGSVVKPVKFSGDSESVPTSPKHPSSAAYHTKSEQNLPGAGKFKNAPNGAGKVAKGQGEAAPKPKHEDHKSKSPVAESKKPAKRAVR